MRRQRKVKILATLGPASSDEAMIRKLHEAGADLFRINMSHASHEIMRDLIGRIRNVEKEVGRPIGILCDIQGPKLRVGKFSCRPAIRSLSTTSPSLATRRGCNCRIRKFSRPCRLGTGS
jgi:pyruvate kinase